MIEVGHLDESSNEVQGSTGNLEVGSTHVRSVLPPRFLLPFCHLNRESTPSEDIVRTFEVVVVVIEGRCRVPSRNRHSYRSLHNKIDSRNDEFIS